MLFCCRLIWLQPSLLLSAVTAPSLTPVLVFLLTVEQLFWHCLPMEADGEEVEPNMMTAKTLGFHYVYSIFHRVGRVVSFFSSRRNWDSPNPSPAGECAPPSLSQFRRGDIHCGTLHIYVLYCISLMIKPLPVRPPPFCIPGRSRQLQDRSRPPLPAGAEDGSGAGQPALAHPLFAHSRAASRTGVSEAGYKMSSFNLILFLPSLRK
jgi:hypothetical protein